MKTLLRIWAWPAWVGYAVAVGTVGLAVLLRLQMHEALQDRAPYALMTVAIAISAVVGGLGPGILACVASVYLGVYVLLPNTQAGTSMTPAAQLQLFLTIGVWLFIVIICDFLRSTSLSLNEQTKVTARERDRLTLMLDSMNDGYYQVDQDLRILQANQAIGKLVQVDASQMVNRSVPELFPQTPEVHRELEAAARSQTPLVRDVGTNDGSERWFNLRAFPADGTLHVFVHDVSLRYEVERRKEALLAYERLARSEAERLSRLKDEFVATVSHELRTPLTTILGWTEILSQRLPEMTATEQEAVGAIQRAAERQSALIEELLDTSRLALGKVRLDLVQVDLCALASEVVHHFTPTAELKSIRLTAEIQTPNCWVTADPSRLHQVFANVIGNALKFTPPGGEIRVMLEVNPTQVRISVIDTGEGIRPEFLQDLFQRFRQGTGAISRKHGGLGLGLAIARDLVTLHGGTIEAHSEGPGFGSRFTVTLPRIERPPYRELETPTSVNLDQLRERRVILVEDDEPTRKLLVFALREVGLNVVDFEDATAALLNLRLSKEPVDLLISDIGLPNLDGYEFMGKLREEGLKRFPAIVLSALARNEDVDRAISSGYDRHMSKPVQLSSLMKVIADILSASPV